MEGGGPNQTILSEIERMPEAPRQRISHHRRARSETFFSGESIDDLLLFDPSDIDFSSLDFLNTPPPLQPQPSPMSVDSPPEETSSNGVPPNNPLPPKPFGRHVRSFSVDSDFFDDLGVTEEQFTGKSLATSSGEKKKKGNHHNRSSSMDGETSSALFNIESILASVSGKDGGGKKNMGMGGDRLAELALLDPKRAKRILANRQSAARSKERKIRYTGELERKVQTLQNEATTLSAQVTMLQRGTSELNTENKHLKMRLQALEQQAELRDALNEALRDELNRLKIAAGEISQGNGNAYNGGQFSSQQSTMNQFGNNKNQQMSSNGQPSHPSFMDFTKRG
ncbi:PREDICTED: transcription factor VIP1 isoform X1 [Camelina sativa]|uniref:Transcription factor VIP1 isoform X1 n=1 Tax=Camelina sativa TaxID=90675 RepID=A0ABM0X0Z4_CAMSA|nr:PREDICTED: transcription factor VIP1 isoform X2 [Camelina sativa]XP_019095362.1 PREDICTED: transcription factor VIP1 isoform X1 [Camelina sativa]